MTTTSPESTPQTPTSVQIGVLRTSPTIGAIGAALAKAQAKIKGAHKDAENPHFRSKYADLSSVWEACRIALSENQIAVVQGAGTGESTAVVTTQLIHASGEFLASTLELLPSKPDPQGFGSALTYGRRYGLASMVGVAPEDDDGNAASGPRQQAQPPARSAQPSLTPSGARFAPPLGASK